MNNFTLFYKALKVPVGFRKGWVIKLSNSSKMEKTMGKRAED